MLLVYFSFRSVFLNNDLSNFRLSCKVDFTVKFPLTLSDPCDNVTCMKNSICKDGKCQCDSGYVMDETYGYCRIISIGKIHSYPWHVWS